MILALSLVFLVISLVLLVISSVFLVISLVFLVISLVFLVISSVFLVISLILLVISSVFLVISLVLLCTLPWREGPSAPLPECATRGSGIPQAASREASRGNPAQAWDCDATREETRRHLLFEILKGVLM
jgi:hypothetical protein